MHLVDWVAGAGRTDEFRMLSRWFEQVCRVRERFAKCMSGDFDPLGSNETASVGFLAAAASRAGLLTLTDYVSVKRGWEDRAPFRLGRCDLWVADPRRQRSWAFEFKQALIGNGAALPKVGKLLDQACFDARRVDRLEADYRYGALVIGFQNRTQSEEHDADLRQISAQSTYCCRLCGRAAPTWIFLQAV